MTSRRRHGLPVDGVLLLDKPAGLTSNAALQTAKRLLNARKAGHTGSLDPIATGLMLLTFGEATKLSQFLLDADKRYSAVFRLGQSTMTYDSEGEVTQTRPVSVSRRSVEQALKRFEGEIEQVPPMYSAVKQAGQALYKLARAGIEVERAPRRVVVREFRLLALDGERLEVAIACSKGTYVRSLAQDLGEVLGCGAHVVALRRLAVGGIGVERAVTLAGIEALDTHAARAALLQPADAMLTGMPAVNLTALAVHYLSQGQAVTARHDVASGWVRLYAPGERFLGLGEVLDDGRVTPRRLTATEK